MNYEEYRGKLKGIEKRRKMLFKKINKCDSEIRKLNNEYFLDKIGFKRGDCYIYSPENGETEFYKITSMELLSENVVKIILGKCNNDSFVRNRNAMDYLQFYVTENNDWKLPVEYIKRKS